ncbi:hypothetical protein D320_02462 [Haloferax sp. BAB-2207]|nr:hypothetical protein D320_02462 [Haloferax sp. BAB-2207]
MALSLPFELGLEARASTFELAFDFGRHGHLDRLVLVLGPGACEFTLKLGRALRFGLEASLESLVETDIRGLPRILSSITPSVETETLCEICLCALELSLLLSREFFSGRDFSTGGFSPSK